MPSLLCCESCGLVFRRNSALIPARSGSALRLSSYTLLSGYCNASNLSECHAERRQTLHNAHCTGAHRHARVTGMMPPPHSILPAASSHSRALDWPGRPLEEPRRVPGPAGGGAARVHNDGRLAPAVQWRCAGHGRVVLARAVHGRVLPQGEGPGSCLSGLLPLATMVLRHTWLLCARCSSYSPAPPMSMPSKQLDTVC